MLYKKMMNDILFTKYVYRLFSFKNRNLTQLVFKSFQRFWNGNFQLKLGVNILNEKKWAFMLNQKIIQQIYITVLFQVEFYLCMFY